VPAAAGAWVPPTTERQWKWIVLHHSDDDSGSVAKYDRYHRYTKHWEHGCGYHFVIGNGTETRDGEVEMGPRWSQQLHGAHAKTPDNRYNEHGVGICLVGDFHHGSGRPSEAQMDSLVQLTRWLMARYDIPEANVQGHCDCCKTNCPGRNFPWADFRRRLVRRP
jgi:N-acetyl-anhydromuramyl-L-alanine amidase AmpD